MCTLRTHLSGKHAFRTILNFEADKLEQFREFTPRAQLGEPLRVFDSLDVSCQLLSFEFLK